jgi:hypothetical protein
MAGRIRTIKPELLEDEKTAGLSDSASRVFIGMILLADDYGNLRAEPKYLEGQIYWSVVPETSVKVSLKSLETLCTYYTVRGQLYAHINGWEKHQRVQHPGKPRVPGPSERDSGESPEIIGESHESLAPDLRPPTSDHRPHTIEPDERVSEQPPASPPVKVSSRGSRIPENWRPQKPEPLEALIDRCQIADWEVEAELEGFRDFWTAKAGKDANKVDWDATFRTRLRNQVIAGRIGGHRPPQAEPEREIGPMKQLFNAETGTYGSIARG